MSTPLAWAALMFHVKLLARISGRGAFLVRGPYEFNVIKSK